MAGLSEVSAAQASQTVLASAPARGVSARSAINHAAPLHVVVSIGRRRVWAISGNDTLLNAPAAVAKGTTLEYAGERWAFKTPRGTRRVLRKQANPIWTPPDWMYAEAAARHGLRLGHLSASSPTPISDGRSLTTRRGVVGVLDQGRFEALPMNEHIVFDDKLFIPPLGSKNRRIEGQLGHFGLDLGDGYMLHGTPFQESIGRAATHGCIRLHDADIAWLYDHVPVGTRVEIR